MPATSFRHTTLRDILFLSVLFSIFYFAYLGSYPLFIPDEGRYAEAAREMVATGDYITPRVNGMTFLDKPILYYWQSALAIKTFGVSEWTIRLVPILYGLLGILLTYVCGRKLFDRRTALCSALILCSSPLYFAGAHYANLDLEVAVLISASLYFFMMAMNEPSRLRNLFLVFSYLSNAAAFLTKGMIGIAFPAMIIGTWILLLKRWHTFKQMHLIAGLLLFIVVVLPWYVLVQQANPAFFDYFFVTQQVTRFLSAAEFNNKSPFWFYLPVVLLGFFPWSIFLFQTLKETIQSIWHKAEQYPQTLFLLLWVGIIFIFFSIPHSKIVGYILPIFPPLSLLVGRYIALKWKEPGLKQFYPAILFVLCCIVSLLFLFILKLNVNHLNHNTSKPLVTKLKPLLQPDDEIINYFKFYQDIPVYLERHIKVVADWQSPDIPYKDNWRRELWLGMKFPKNADSLMDEKTFLAHWNSPKRLFVFVEKNYREQFEKRTIHYYQIDRYYDTFLYSNKSPVVR